MLLWLAVDTRKKVVWREITYKSMSIQKGLMKRLNNPLTFLWQNNPNPKSWILLCLILDRIREEDPKTKSILHDFSSSRLASRDNKPTWYSDLIKFNKGLKEEKEDVRKVEPNYFFILFVFFFYLLIHLSLLLSSCRIH